MCALAAGLPASDYCNTGIFLVSGARLIALSISHRGEKGKTQSTPGWSPRRALSLPERVSILEQLQHSPFSLLPGDSRQLPIYQGGKDPPNVGDYIVEIDGFYYDYYILPGEYLPNPKPRPKPYARTLARLSRFDFVIPGEVPAGFANRPLLFIGLVVPQEVMTTEPTDRSWVRGLAIIPLDINNRPDFTHAVCARPACDFTR